MQNVKLGTRLFLLLIAAIILSSTGVAIVLISFGQRAARVEAFNFAQGIAEAVADDIEALIGSIDAVLTSPSLFPGFAELQADTQRAVLQNLLLEFPYFERLAVRNRSGELLAVVRKGPEAWTPPPEIIRRAFETAVRGEIYISDVHYAPETAPEILVMAPIASPGENPVGTIAGIVELSPLQQMIRDVRLGTGSALFIVDSHGRVIAHSELGEEVIGRSFLHYRAVRNAVSGRRDTTFGREDIYVDPAGNRVIAAYRRLPQTGWSVVIQQPVEVAFGPDYRMIGYALAWTLVFALVFGVLGLYLIRRIEQEHEAAVKSDREARTLYRVSQELASTLRLEKRLRVIAESLQDVCGTSKTAIWTLDRNNIVPAVSLGLTPDEEEVFRGVEVHMEEISEQARQAIFAGKPIVVTDAQAGGFPYPDFAASLNIKSMLALPITLEAESIGFGITFSPGEIRDFTPDHIRLAQALASQAATAIENVRAYERERRIAETLQRALLPTVPPSIDDFEIADRYSAASEESEIGGDFYDVFELAPDKVGIVIADVSGKGLSAGVHTAMVKYMLRAYAADNLDPVPAVSKLNNAVYKSASKEMFVTLFYGVLDITKKELVYVNAGHELPLLYGEDRKICMRLITTGTALGIIPDYKFDMDRIDFLPRDVLLFYTDGATDARRDGGFLGIEGLESLFCSVASGDAHQIVDDIDRGVREFAGGSLRDDMALVVLKRRRPPEIGKRPRRQSRSSTVNKVDNP